MAADAGEFAPLDQFDDRPQVGGSELVDAIGIDHGPVGEDLEEHAELAAVVGSAQGHPGQERVGRGHRTARARPGATRG